MKTKTVSPELFRKEDEIYAQVRLNSGNHITVRRSTDQQYDSTTGRKPKFVARIKAVISWSGGNGAQTPAQTVEMANWLRWAASVAHNLNVRNPRSLSDKDILWNLNY